MIRQDIYINEIGWKVVVCYNVTCRHAGLIMRELRSVGCRGKQAEEAYNNLLSCRYNSGFTYSKGRKTVMVIGIADRAGEFINTLVHELKHLSGHIEKALGIDAWSEQSAYLIGDMAQIMYERVISFICEMRKSADYNDSQHFNNNNKTNPKTNTKPRYYL